MDSQLHKGRMWCRSKNYSESILYSDTLSKTQKIGLVLTFYCDFIFFFNSIYHIYQSKNPSSLTDYVFHCFLGDPLCFLILFLNRVVCYF